MEREHNASAKTNTIRIWSALDAIMDNRIDEESVAKEAPTHALHLL